MSALLKQHLKPFERYFKRPGLVEVCINQPGEIWLETITGWERVEDKALSTQALNDMAGSLATSRGQRYDPIKIPLLSTTIPVLGHRIQVIGGGLLDTLPNGDQKIAISIRLSLARRFSLASYFDPLPTGHGDLKKEKTFSNPVENLEAMVRSGKTILVVGGTGSGKTSYINSLLPFIPKETRLVTVEDSKELAVDHPNRVGIIKSKSGTDIAQATYKDIIGACMRIRPDRLLMGELDIDNTAPFLRLLNTGHAGCMATLHADSPEEAIEAIVQNAILSGQIANNPDYVRNYAKKALDAVVFIKRHEGRHFRATVVDAKNL